MFSESNRRNALLGSIAIIAMIFACGASIRLYKLSVPEQVEHDTVSFSQAAYDEALEKWRSADVRSYELTVHSGDDDVVLRVSDGGSIQVLQHLFRDRPIDENAMSKYSASLRTMTVEHLFALAADPLRGVRPSDKDHPLQARYTYFYDFHMRFDERLGYPTYMRHYERYTRPSREITWRVSLWPPVEVKDLKVLDSR